MEQTGNDAHAGEVGASAGEEALDTGRAGLESADPPASFRAVSDSGGRHAGEKVEKPELARKAGMRGGAREKRGRAALVDTTFDEVPRDLIVLELLGKASEAPEAVLSDHSVFTNEAREALLHKLSLPPSPSFSLAAFSCKTPFTGPSVFFGLTCLHHVLLPLYSEIRRHRAI